MFGFCLAPNENPASLSFVPTLNLITNFESPFIFHFWSVLRIMWRSAHALAIPSLSLLTTPSTPATPAKQDLFWPCFFCKRQLFVCFASYPTKAFFCGDPLFNNYYLYFLPCLALIWHQTKIQLRCLLCQSFYFVFNFESLLS